MFGVPLLCTIAFPNLNLKIQLLDFVNPIAVRLKQIKFRLNVFREKFKSTIVVESCPHTNSSEERTYKLTKSLSEKTLLGSLA